MATPPIQWIEPQAFAAGDTLSFQKNLPDWPPSAGWSIHGTLSQVVKDGAIPVTGFVSAPDPTNAFHVVYQQNWASGIVGGIYVFSAELINAGTGEKHQLWYNDNFLISPDLNDGLAGGQVKTTAQEMIEILTQTLKDIYKSKFAETEVQRNRFNEKNLKDTLDALKFWKAVRTQEIQYENVRNGRPSGAVSQPIFAVG